jgi:predicted Zn-dependent peptidase
MRASRLPRLAAALAALLCTGCGALGLGPLTLGRGAPDPRTMTFPTLPLAPPAPQRVVLENGVVVYLLRDPEVPIVNVQVLVRTGAVLEPADKVDLAEVTGRAMRTGGTRRYPVAALNAKLEQLGATLETGIGRQSGTAALSVLAPDLPVGIELLAEVLRRPVFDAEEVERIKLRRIEEIRRSDDDPDAIAFRTFRAAVYGDDPRGRIPTPEMTGSITRDEVAAFHARFFHPDRVIVGVTGLFDEAELLGLLRKELGDWQPAGVPAEPFPLPRQEPRAGLTLVQKELPQATIIMGHLAPAKDAPEHHAFTVLNYILGGAGFNSRLTEEIRSNRGLAYSVGSFYRGDVGYGVFGGYSKTRTASALEAARLMLGIMKRVRLEGVTPGELRWAKDAIVNNLIFTVEGSREIVAEKMSYEYDGLPADFLERYRDRVEAVTAEDVLAVARRYLRPADAATVIVGDEGGLGGSLEGFGPVGRTTLRKY